MSKWGEGLRKGKSEVLLSSSLSFIRGGSPHTFYTPLNEPTQIKFNGSRRFKKATDNNIHNQSIYEKPKTSIRCSDTAYIDHLNDQNPETFKPQKKKAPETPKSQINTPRGYGDFGATKNRRKIPEKKTDINPILQNNIASHSHSQSNIWKQDRRQRDNGALFKTALGWQPSKNSSTYLSMHRAKFNK